MNREIKFRAWHKGHPGRIKASMVFDNTPGDCLRWFAENQPIEIMQFTGLKDKNGKEIYEGDIVELDPDYFLSLGFSREGESNRARVWHDDEVATFNIGDLRDSIIPRKDLAAQYYTVVGNIYETPELLTDHKNR